MNLVKAVVTEVISDEPYKRNTMWFVKVKCNCYGSISEKELMFETKQQAEQVEVGYDYLT